MKLQRQLGARDGLWFASRTKVPKMFVSSKALLASASGLSWKAALFFVNTNLRTFGNDRYR